MSLLVDGLKLMVVGMGMVFAFLVIMIFWVMLSAKISAKFAHLLPDDVKPAPRRKKSPATKPAAGSSDQSTVAAAVSAAVQAYRADRT
ncbi:MAG: OadG family protein [Lentisphaeria bacterium]|nr:OadG family protein [Lentisphaeria bacterium]